MDIAIIGAGNVGSALGARFAAAGHTVTYGVRNPDDKKYQALAETGKIAGLKDAADNAEIIVIAAYWDAFDDIAGAIAPATGKTIIDCTNPLGMTDGGFGLKVGFDTSGGEILQSKLPEANVVKAFNQIGAEYMADPDLLEHQPVMFMAGDSDEAKQPVRQLITDIGFEAQDAGPLSNARLLEPMAMLWIWSAINGKLGRDFGFAVSHKKAE